MKLKSLPIELFVEVLNYLADYERLDGLAHIFEGDYTVTDVRNALRETALHLRKIVEEGKEQKSLPDYQKDGRFSTRSRQILSVLSPGDERKLLERFGLLEE